MNDCEVVEENYPLPGVFGEGAKLRCQYQLKYNLAPPDIDWSERDDWPIVVCSVELPLETTGIAIHHFLSGIDFNSEGWPIELDGDRKASILEFTGRDRTELGAFEDCERKVLRVLEVIQDIGKQRLKRLRERDKTRIAASVNSPFRTPSSPKDDGEEIMAEFRRISDAAATALELHLGFNGT